MSWASRIAFLAGALACMVASPVIAQSSPGFIAGQPLTAAQLNNSFAGKLDYQPLGNSAGLNVGTTGGTVAAGNDSRILGAEQTANKGVADGYAGLNGSAQIAIANIPLGTTSSTVVVGNDSRVVNAIQASGANTFTAGQKIDFGSTVTSGSALISGATLTGIAATGNIARIQLLSYGTFPAFTCSRANGSSTSISAVLSGEQVCSFNAYAYGVGSMYGPISSVRMYAAENISSTAQGSKVCLATTPATTTAMADGLCQQASGGVVVGAATGGDKGIGTVNGVGLYQNGTALTTAATTALGTSGAVIPLLSTANTWALGQTFTTAPVFTDQSGSRSALGLGTAAVANTGTSGANVPLLNAANTWATTQTLTVAPVFTDQSGSRTALGLGTAATAATGTSGATVPLLNGANTFSGDVAISTSSASPLTVTEVATGATGGPTVILTRSSSSPTNNDATGTLQFQSKNSAAATVNMGSIGTIVSNVTSAAETAYLRFVMRTAGTLAEEGRWGGGISVGAATGGTKGTGTINATGYYLNNVAFGTSATVNTGTSGATIPLLNGTNTWANAQTFTTAPVFTDASTTRTNLGLTTAATTAIGTSGATIPLLSTGNIWSTNQQFSANTQTLGLIGMGTPVALTIASDAITVTNSNVTVDTEASAPTDNLATISGGSTGDILFIRSANSTRDPIFTAGGNINLGALTCTLATTSGMAMLVKVSTQWNLVSCNGG